MTPPQFRGGGETLGVTPGTYVSPKRRKNEKKIGINQDCRGDKLRGNKKTKVVERLLTSSYILGNLQSL